jgi:hypothetical protein
MVQNECVGNSFSCPRTFAASTLSKNSISLHSLNHRPRFTQLKMSGGDFDEATYTESAWACIASLTKVADYYSSNTVDAPMLLDVLLNPSKHNAGENAESAKRVVEKIFLKADVDMKGIRSELEQYMSKQPKITGSSDSQKTMGRPLVSVLDKAREAKTLLGVCLSLSHICIRVKHFTNLHNTYSGFFCIHRSSYPRSRQRGHLLSRCTQKSRKILR